MLCDAPAVPLVAADACVPGFLMSNFTWADIYAPCARAVGGDALRFVADFCARATVRRPRRSGSSRR